MRMKELDRRESWKEVLLMKKLTSNVTNFLETLQFVSDLERATRLIRILKTSSRLMMWESQLCRTPRMTRCTSLVLRSSPAILDRITCLWEWEEAPTSWTTTSDTIIELSRECWWFTWLILTRASSGLLTSWCKATRSKEAWSIRTCYSQELLPPYLLWEDQETPQLGLQIDLGLLEIQTQTVLLLIAREVQRQDNDI